MTDFWEKQAEKRNTITLEVLEKLFDAGYNLSQIGRLYPKFFSRGSDVKQLYEEYLKIEDPDKESPCEYCGRSLKNTRKDMHLTKCIPFQLYKRERFPKEILYDLYIKQGLSANVIGENRLFGNATSVITLLNEYQIPTRSNSEAAMKDDSKKKRRKTLLKKTGYSHNFSKNSPSRKRWESRLLEEEGITNVFQRESVKRKSIKTLIKKYGVDTPGKLPARGRKVISSLNRRIIKFLQNNNIDFEIEKKILKKDGGYYSFDFYFPDTNRLIEINGDYWHGNPRIYKGNDLILKGSSGEMKVSDKWKKDNQKIKFAKKKRLDILIIWEYDMNHNWKQTSEQILEFINGKN